MSIFKWSEKYMIGIEVIDTQHQKLFEIMTSLYEAMKTGKGNQVTVKVLKELQDYTKYHFKEEETLMARAGYKDLPSHKKTHAEFIKKIDEKAAEVTKASALSINLELADFLIDWLKTHIQGTDRNYASLLIEKGIK